MVIRKANKEDMSAVLDLIKELAIFHEKLDAVLMTEDDLIENGFSENPLFHCLVADIDGEIIGIALYYFTFSTWAGKTLHLEDLVIKKSKRGTGAGSALYKEMIRVSQREKVGKMEWLVADWNHAAIEFYKKTGATISEGTLVVQMDKAAIDRFID